jgi:hypothetical protein
VAITAAPITTIATVPAGFEIIDEPITRGQVDLFGFGRMKLPLVRQIYSKTIVERIMEVQPLIGPDFPLIR